MIAQTGFKFCPRCGNPAIKRHQKNAMQCQECGYVYFHNTASAVAGILCSRGKIMLVKRNHVPQKGYFDLPGGFVDHGESAEAALRREIKEELAIELEKTLFFHTFPNTYDYKGVRYFTCDMVFICPIPLAAIPKPNNEIAEIVFVKPQEINYNQLAFKSTRNALKQYTSTH